MYMIYMIYMIYLIVICPRCAKSKARARYLNLSKRVPLLNKKFVQEVDPDYLTLARWRQTLQKGSNGSRSD